MITAHKSSISKSHLKSCIPTIPKSPIHNPRTNNTGMMAFAAAAALQRSKYEASKKQIEFQKYRQFPGRELVNHSELLQYSKCPNCAEEAQKTKYCPFEKRSSEERYQEKHITAQRYSYLRINEGIHSNVNPIS